MHTKYKYLSSLVSDYKTKRKKIRQFGRRG